MSGTGKTSMMFELRQDQKGIGFKSFPDHWTEVKNEGIWQREIMDDFRVKKVILAREDELAVYVSMKRAEKTGNYMTKSYPKDLKLHIDPASFQIFVNNYWDTYRRRYKSTFEKRDTFRVSYEQLLDEESFKLDILPLLWKFLGVNAEQPMKTLSETVKQAEPNEDLSKSISNYEELEFCFRHTQVKHFQFTQSLRTQSQDCCISQELLTREQRTIEATWSLLLPICSRLRLSEKIPMSSKDKQAIAETFNKNRLTEVAVTSQYLPGEPADESTCWKFLEDFAASLKATSAPSQLKKTECVVGIDIDDAIFSTSQERIRNILPCSVKFVTIRPVMYGRVCRIWNHLASFAGNDFIILLGDDVVLKDKDWQGQVAAQFKEISTVSRLPLGAACVALNDESFPGFPTFPVVHRWHMQRFESLLPKQFVNQGGDPYIYELYSRFNAAKFAVNCRMQNRIGGDGDARYKKHEINWKGQILRLNMAQLAQDFLKTRPKGVVLDVIVPSYRMENEAILRSILNLSCSIPVYVKFWVVVDRPDPRHLADVKALAQSINDERFRAVGNYFVEVLNYNENRGASFARNFGYNYSTADWALFLDDDVIPSPHLLDAYVGAIARYPEAKVFVGSTQLPVATNTWTKMLRTCNIMFFYGIAEHMTHPPWGVTANLMVRGSRHNSTIQFKNVYPKTGGGEDIDFCFQFKAWYKSKGDRTVVAVPGAEATHPWWKGGSVCYDQINGWAWGDSLCLSEWPEKTFRTLPNWIESIVLLTIPLFGGSGQWKTGLLASTGIAITEHLLLAAKYYPHACRQVKTRSFRKRFWIALGAGSILSFQEVTRLAAHLRRGHFRCLCRRMDWNDGQNPRIKLDTQLNSIVRFVLYTGVVVGTHWWCKNQSTQSGMLF